MKWIILIVLLAVIAPKLPAIGNALGRAIRNFKRGLEGKEEKDPLLVNPKDGTKNEDDKS